MYLVLRRRLTEVSKEWVVLGMEVMRDARKAKGLSYEGVARQIPVSSKTYERYEKRGAVPVELVDKFAVVLDLEIERPEFRRVVSLPTEEASGEAERLDHLEEQLEGANRRLDRILGLLGDSQQE